MMMMMIIIKMIIITTKIVVYKNNHMYIYIYAYIRISILYAEMWHASDCKHDQSICGPLFFNSNHYPIFAPYLPGLLMNRTLSWLHCKFSLRIDPET